MISFGLTEEQELVRSTLREFASDVVRPIARECDEASKLSEEFLAQVWDLSLVSTQLPDRYGGGGEARSPITNALILEELACGDATLALAALAPAGFAFAIADQGSEAQKKQYLPLFSGQSYHAACLAVDEPGPASNASAPRTLAAPDGDGYRLSGAKCLVPMGDRASHFLVIAGVGDDLGAFIVARDAEGLTVSEPERNLGLRALPTATLEFERVAVSAGDRLGGPSGCDVQRLLNHSRAALAAVMVGVSRAAVEYATPYAKQRQAFGQAIAQKQAIAFRLADMHIETESSRWLTWKAASQLERGLDATRAAHLALTYAAEKALWVTDQGVQVLGGHGFIREHPAEMWYRNTRTLGVLEGGLAL